MKARQETHEKLYKSKQSKINEYNEKALKEKDNKNWIFYGVIEEEQWKVKYVCGLK